LTKNLKNKTKINPPNTHHTNKDHIGIASKLRIIALKKFYLGNPNIEPISLFSFFKGSSYDYIYHFDQHGNSLGF
jgi:hypothetical protein